jgi:hypothetical protein
MVFWILSSRMKLKKRPYLIGTAPMREHPLSITDQIFFWKIVVMESMDQYSVSVLHILLPLKLPLLQLEIRQNDRF